MPTISLGIIAILVALPGGVLLFNFWSSSDLKETLSLSRNRLTSHVIALMSEIISDVITKQNKTERAVEDILSEENFLPKFRELANYVKERDEIIQIFKSINFLSLTLRYALLFIFTLLVITNLVDPAKLPTWIGTLWWFLLALSSSYFIIGIILLFINEMSFSRKTNKTLDED